MFIVSVRLLYNTRLDYFLCSKNFLEMLLYCVVHNKSTVLMGKIRKKQVHTSSLPFKQKISYWFYSQRNHNKRLFATSIHICKCNTGYENEDCVGHKLHTISRFFFILVFNLARVLQKTKKNVLLVELTRIDMLIGLVKFN